MYLLLSASCPSASLSAIHGCVVHPWLLFTLHSVLLRRSTPIGLFIHLVANFSVDHWEIDGEKAWARSLKAGGCVTTTNSREGSLLATEKAEPLCAPAIAFQWMGCVSLQDRVTLKHTHPHNFKNGSAADPGLR